MTYAIGECRAVMAGLGERTIQTCVTSPPYWGLRDYGHADQLGLEQTPDAYVANMVDVFRAVRRVLRDDGTLWLNLGDSYAATTKGSGGSGVSGIGHGKGQTTNAGSRFGERRLQIPRGLKPKDLCGIPWRVAFALQADGWYLRSDIIWHKPNPMPESVTDRPTKAHEYVFLLSKSGRYVFDAAAIAEQAGAFKPSRGLGVKTESISSSLAHSTLGGNGSESGERNARTVWTIASQPFGGAHFATMPPALAERCILAGSRVGDTVLDPFFGSGTVGMVAERCGRRWFGCEVNPAYETLIRQRTAQLGLFAPQSEAVPA